MMMIMMMMLYSSYSQELNEEHGVLVHNQTNVTVVTAQKYSPKDILPTHRPDESSVALLFALLNLKNYSRWQNA